MGEASQLVPLRILRPLGDGDREQPQGIAEDADEEHPDDAMLLRVGAMVPQQVRKQGEGEIVVAPVGAVEEGQQGDREEVIAEDLLLLHQPTLSPVL